MIKQRTIAQVVKAIGIGLHKGEEGHNNSPTCERKYWDCISSCRP